MESFAHEVGIRVGVRSTDLSSVSRIFVNDLYGPALTGSRLSDYLLSIARVQHAERLPKAILPKHRCTLLESPGTLKKYCCLALTPSQCDLIAIGCELGSGIFKGPQVF